MNRDQILAAFRAGKITHAECARELGKLPGIRLGLKPMSVEIFATDTELDETTRTITGTITVFGVESSDGRVIEPGAFVDVRSPLDRVKLLIDHDTSQPVGYMTELDVQTDLARATFHVPQDTDGNGDRALEQAKLKLRNGMSIGAAAKAGGYFWDESDVLHFTALELYETSLCSIPAFQDAQVEHVAAQLAHNRKENTRMNREQIEAAFAAGTITAEQRDAALATLELVGTPSAPAPVVAAVTPPAVPGVAVPAEFAAGPDAEGTGAATRPGHTSERRKSFRDVAAGIVALAKDHDLAGIVRYVNAELGQVGVAQDAADAFLRPEWLGEVWQAAPAGRPWVDSFGGAKPLTSDKIEGFRWARPDEYTNVGTDVEARAEIYPGNFTEVPTGTRKLVKVSFEPDQWGVGLKVDRIFTDLGSPDLIASLFAVLGRDYEADSDAQVRADVVAGATVAAAPDASVVAALTGVALELKRIGGSLDRVWLSEDMFGEFSELTVAQLPAWLANQLGFVDLSDGSATVSSKLRMDVDFGLADGTLLGYDRRAATVRETPEIKLQALDIAHRATDIGFFAYGGVLINDARAIIKRTIA